MFLSPSYKTIELLASPRILHLTDDTENCGSFRLSPLTRCGSFAWPRAVPRAISIIYAYYALP